MTGISNFKQSWCGNWQPWLILHRYQPVSEMSGFDPSTCLRSTALQFRAFIIFIYEVTHLLCCKVVQSWSMIYRKTNKLLLQNFLALKKLKWSSYWPCKNQYNQTYFMRCYLFKLILVSIPQYRTISPRPKPINGSSINPVDQPYTLSLQYTNLKNSCPS